MLAARRIEFCKCQIGIEQFLAEPCRNVCRNKSLRMRSRPDVAVIVGNTFGDRRKSVVGSNENVGRFVEAQLRQRIEQCRETCIGICNSRFCSGTVDAGCDRAETILLGVLRSIGIARPEDQYKRLAVVLNDGSNAF